MKSLLFAQLQTKLGDVVSSQVMVSPSFLGILLMIIAVAVFFIALLWKKGKTVEALLVINALLQIIIILILLSS